MCELLTTTYFLPKSIYMSINDAQTFYGFKKTWKGTGYFFLKGVTKYFLKLPMNEEIEQIFGLLLSADAAK